MKRLLYTLQLLSVFSISIILASCTQDECCDDMTVTIVEEETDTLYVNQPRVETQIYTVQIGAFANKSYADEFLKNAKPNFGVNLKMARSSDGIYRISIGEFTSLDEAEVVLRTAVSKGYLDSFIRDSSGPLNR
ncbi:MAG: SPOR domain-containing protein [Candidatus Kapaibacterium sp.]